MDPKSLREFLDGLVSDPKYKPSDGKTFCNLGAKAVCEFFGCKDFDIPNLLADTMYHLMASNISGRWMKLDPEAASVRANAGELVFSALPSWVIGGEHGHIAACYPGPMDYSPSLKTMCPVVANIGKENGIFKTSKVYPVKEGMPRFYIWIPG